MVRTYHPHTSPPSSHTIDIDTTYDSYHPTCLLTPCSLLFCSCLQVAAMPQPLAEVLRLYLTAFHMLRS